MPEQSPQPLTDNTTVRAERAGDAAAIETLLDVCFGPDRFKKTAYRFREGVAPIKALSFVVEDKTTKALVGTIRYWPVILPDGTPSLLLGPIAVEPARQSEGIGIELMNYSMGIARGMHYAAILLVGDAPYYNRFGFVRDVMLGITLPGWVDEERFLGYELIKGVLSIQRGMLGKWPDTVF
ncbi:MAG: N-acetyltransferase [Alphaproteobacteria bacterium]|nr:N-acetyltransferase [Alphaproteobacteria bacterium]